jgi:hypothetical protein
VSPHLHTPCLFIRVSLASTFVLMLLYFLTKLQVSRKLFLATSTPPIPVRARSRSLWCRRRPWARLRLVARFIFPLRTRLLGNYLVTLNFMIYVPFILDCEPKACNSCWTVISIWTCCLKLLFVVQWRNTRLWTVCVYAWSWAYGGAHTGTTGFSLILGECRVGRRDLDVG